MNDESRAACPRLEEVSALMDGALSGSEREKVAAHAASCPLCGTTLRNFEALSERMQRLRDTRCDVDLASLIASRLPPRGAAPRGARTRPWRDAWHVAPGGFAAAGALVAGAYLGLMLVGGGAALRPPAMAVFDAAPPGALCAGLPSCSPRGK